MFLHAFLPAHSHRVVGFILDDDKTQKFHGTKFRKKNLLIQFPFLFFFSFLVVVVSGGKTRMLASSLEEKEKKNKNKKRLCAI